MNEQVQNQWHRLTSHIFNLFEEFLRRHPISNYQDYNALLEVRNLIIESVEKFLNEPAIKKKYGVPIDALSLVSFSENEEPMNPKSSWIPIPSEEDETRPAGITNEEFAKLSERLQRLFTEVHMYTSPLFIDVLNLFREAFLKPSENRPLKAGTYVRLEFGVPTGESIKKQAVPCEICGENRVTDICHIIPNRLGGANRTDNVLFLCPTHHALFDRCMLSKGEWDKIDWARKSKKAQIYALKVLKVAHEKFWEKVESGVYQKQTTWGIGLYELYGNNLKNDMEKESNGEKSV